MRSIPLYLYLFIIRRVGNKEIGEIVTNFLCWNISSEQTSEINLRQEWVQNLNLIQMIICYVILFSAICVIDKPLFWLLEIIDLLIWSLFLPKSTYTNHTQRSLCSYFKNILFIDIFCNKKLRFISEWLILDIFSKKRSYLIQRCE